MKCVGQCLNVSLTIQGHKFKTYFYVIDLHGVDVILGVAWQETVGEIKVNFRESYLKFQLDGKEICLQGKYQNPHSELISTFNLKKLIHKGEVSNCFIIQLLTQPTTISSTEPTLYSLHSDVTTSSLLPKPLQSPSHPQPEINHILQSYSDIFDEPKSLPPKRAFDHHIPLEPNSKPVNVRPYRFPHFQKKEIENQVQQMLDSGTIKPSTSAYSSPVLLVKKKEGTWRLCVDCRALNTLTVKD